MTEATLLTVFGTLAQLWAVAFALVWAVTEWRRTRLWEGIVSHAEEIASDAVKYSLPNDMTQDLVRGRADLFPLERLHLFMNAWISANRDPSYSTDPARIESDDEAKALMDGLGRMLGASTILGSMITANNTLRQELTTAMCWSLAMILHAMMYLVATPLFLSVGYHYYLIPITTCAVFSLLSIRKLRPLIAKESSPQDFDNLLAHSMGNLQESAPPHLRHAIRNTSVGTGEERSGTLQQPTSTVSTRSTQ